MKVNLKKVDDNNVRLECVATPQEVNAALNEASIAFAQNMGIRPAPNKTVQQLVEEQLGVKDLDAVVQAQAIDNLAPYAIDEKNIMPAYPPHPESQDTLKRDAEFPFTMDVALKPEYELKSYDPVTIEVPAFKLDEGDVQREIDKLTERYMDFVTADPKPVEENDTIFIALEATQEGEDLSGLNTEGRPYTLNAGLMPPQFDEGLIGMEVGETKEFTFDAPKLDENGEMIMAPATAKVTFIEQQKQVQPALTDEWVKNHMPMYPSAEALVDDIRLTLSRQRRADYEDFIRGVAAAKLAERFEGSIADELYEAMRTNLMNSIQMELAAQGISWEQFMAQNGGEQQFGMMLMLQTRQSLVQGFSLDALFRHEKLELTEEDLLEAARMLNPQGNAKQTKLSFEENGRGFALREAAQRLKANKYLVDNAIIETIEQ